MSNTPDPFDIVLRHYSYEMDHFRQVARSLSPVSTLLKRVKRVFGRYDSEGPCTVLITGHVGLGKTELAVRFSREAEKCALTPVWLDWREVLRKYPDLLKKDILDIDDLLNAIYVAFRDHGFDAYFDVYKNESKLIWEAERKVTKGLETTTAQNQGNDVLAKLSRLGAKSLRLLMGILLHGHPGGQAVIKISESVPDDVKSLAEEILAAGLQQTVLALAHVRLSRKEYEAYVNGTDHLLDALAESLFNLSNDHRIVTILDHYEIVLQGDAWFRYLLWKAGSRIVWIIASQPTTELLAVYRSDPHLNQGLIDIQLSPLTIEETEELVNTHPLKLRNGTPGEIRRLYETTIGNPWALGMALTLWYPGKTPGIEEFRATSAGQSSIAGAIFDQYMLRVLADDRERHSLEILSFCYDGDLEMFETILGVQNAQQEVADLARRYPFLFDHAGQLIGSVGFWLRANFMQRIKEEQVQRLARLALESRLRDLRAVEAKQSDLAACVESDAWVHIALGVAYYSFWLDEPRAKQALIEVLQAVLWLPQESIAAFLKALWDVIGPLPELRPGLEELVRFFQHGLAHMVMNRDLPVEATKVIFSGDTVRDEYGTTIARINRQTVQRALSLMGNRPTDPQRQAALLAARSRLESMSGAFSSSFRALEQALLLVPESAVETRKLLAYHYRNLGRNIMKHGGAPQIPLYCYEKAISLTERDASVLQDLCQALLANCEYEQVIKVADEIIDMDPSAAAAYNSKGIALQNKQRFDEAEAMYKRGIEQDTEPYTTSILLCNLGILYTTQRKYDEAEHEYDRALELLPNFSFARLCKGLLVQVRNPELAIRELESALDYIQYVDEAYIDNVVKLLSGVGDQSALEHLQKLLVSAEKLESSSFVLASLHSQIGGRYANMRRWREAAYSFESAIRVMPDYLPAYFAAAEAYNELHQPFRSREFTLCALELNVGTTTRMASLSLFLVGMRMSNKEIERWSKESSRSSTSSAEQLMRQGVVQLLMGKYDQAMTFLWKAARGMREDFWPYYALYAAAMQQEHYRKAMEMAEEVIIRLPEGRRGFAYYALAAAAMSEGDCERAIEGYRKSLSEYETNAAYTRSIQSCIQFDMALGFHQLDNEADAVKALEESSLLDPDGSAGRLSRIILLVRKNEFEEARLEMRRLDRDLRWETFIDLEDCKWRSSRLANAYHECFALPFVTPLVQAAILVGDESTLRRIIERTDLDISSLLDLARPIYKLSARPVEDLVPRLTELSQLVSGRRQTITPTETGLQEETGVISNSIESIL